MGNRPILNCYWVVPGRLLAGEYPRTLDEDTSKERLRRVEGAGIGAFIDLTEAHERSPYAGLLQKASHQHSPIRDMSVPASRELTLAMLDTIDADLANGTGVYVHCWGGVGRTGVIIGCWLARHGAGRPGGQAALERLRQLWWKCPAAVAGNRGPGILHHVVEGREVTGGKTSRRKKSPEKQAFPAISWNSARLSGDS